jgi:hypothetical protein
MKSVFQLLISVLATITLTAAFAPVAFAPRTSSSVNLFGGKKKPSPASKGIADPDVFGGKGKKITVREDEDNAMWIEEPKEDKKKGQKGK